MIGIGRLWKAVAGGEAEARPPQAGSSIPRDLATLKGAALDPVWDDDAEPSETRTAPRFVPIRSTTMLASASGRRIPARIINLSRTGVAVEADFDSLGVEEITIVGSRPVTPGRRIALGAVFMFKKPLDPKLCEPAIVL